MCEWPCLLVDRGIDLVQLEKELSEKRASLCTLITHTCNSWHTRKDEYDLSHEIKEATSGCLTRKACSTQCPVKVDVPEFRSCFLQLYHARYLRPLRDHMVATVESYTLLVAQVPKTFNLFINQPLVRNLAKEHIGMVDLSLLSALLPQCQLMGYHSVNMTLEQFELLSLEQKVRMVLAIQDPPASYCDVQVVADFIRLVEELGTQPVLLPFLPNDKAQHIEGFSNRFAKTARKTSESLNQVVRLNILIVGVDPALVFCYRNEYKLVLRELRGDLHALLVNKWLSKTVETQQSVAVGGKPWYFLGCCTGVTTLPDAPVQWAAIFARFDVKLENISVGCCGMAGTYSHEVKDHQNSLGVYELSQHQAI